jgi:predicted metalloprotease with PDZ domain
LPILILLYIISPVAMSQPERSEMSFTIAMKQPSTHLYEVQFQCKGIKREWVDVKMPVWMPGYYQVLNYADNVSEFHVANDKGDSLKWEKANYNTWRIYSNNATSLAISYKVKAVRHFVATNYLDEDRGFIAPPGMFMHVAGLILHPVTVTLEPFSKWDRVATGLEPVAGTKYKYYAPDFDVLYDSPILMGNLEELPSFTVKGIPHYFIGYKLGEFDRPAFMNELKKIVTKAVEMMGEVPFKHYTFIAIGPGGGGIEHLNSTAVSFSGTGMNSKESLHRVLSFLAHEYFHNYNVKRIRPIELGPFDYDKGSRTNMLWVAEGITSYYDKMLLARAGVMSENEILQTFHDHITAYENKPGRLFQSVAQSSYDTWSDGPFGRTGDDLNKTISYYDKGPALAMMLDFKIRHETKNKRSLDDVMRSLYKEYYQGKKRGYTEDEFRKVCEQVAGVSLGAFFEYIYTVKAVDYPSYLAYAGLKIDTTNKPLPGAWLGINARERNDSMIITGVDWESPAWLAGIRTRQLLKTINGKPATMQLLKNISDEGQIGSIVRVEIDQQGTTKTIALILDKRWGRSFAISKMAGMQPAQAAILKGWLGVDD